MAADSSNPNANAGSSAGVSAAAAHVPTTPLPTKPVTAISIVLLTESICASMLLPFVGLFVAFLLGVDPSEAGFSSGALVGLFMIGQVASSKLWGHLSDQYGRRVPLIAGLGAGTVTMFLFGFCGNVYMCCFLRFVHGFFNGTTLVAKAVIADITDKTNESKGFALVSITWSLGCIFGSVIGGFLYDPAKNSKMTWLHLSKDGYWAKHPALLPSIVIGCYNLVATLSCIFLLPETNVHRKPLTQMKVVRVVVNRLGLKWGNTHNSASDVVVSDAAEQPMQPHDDENSGDNNKNNNNNNNNNSTSTTTTVASVNKVKSLEEEEAPAQAESTAAVGVHKLSYLQTLAIAPIRNITIFYMLIAASDMTYAETFPLWLILSPPEGLALFSDTISILTLSFSIPAAVANFMFHNMCKKINSNLSFWRLAAAIYSITMIFIPFGSIFSKNRGYFYVMAFGMVRQVSISWAYSLIHLMTAQNAPRGAIGSVYAVSQSFASMTRAIIPFIVAPVFAVTVSKTRPFPFNHYFTFFLAAVPTAVTVGLTYVVQLQSKEVDTMEEEKAEEAAAAADDAVVDERGSRGDSGYHSLVGSFVTNPLDDTYFVPREAELLGDEIRRDFTATQPSVLQSEDVRKLVD